MRHPSIWVFSMLASVGLVTASVAQAQSADLRFLQDMSVSPPFLVVERDAQGKQAVVGGLLADLNRAIAEELGRTAIFIPTPRKRVEAALQDGSGDVLCYIEPAWLERSEAYDWSGPYLSNANLLVARVGRAVPARLDELREARVGTVLGYVYPEFEGRLGAWPLLRDDAPNDEINLTKLVVGRTDYLITHQIYLDYMLKRRPEWADKIGGRLEIRRLDTRCALSRRGQIRADDFNAALRRLRQSRRYDEILARYR